MSWDYRVVIKRDDSNNKNYGIHEVYYNEAGLTDYCTDTPCDPYGETLEELKENLIQMMGAFLEPIIEYDDIGGHKNSAKVKEVVNELYRTSYLDHYAKKEILQGLEYPAHEESSATLDFKLESAEGLEALVHGLYINNYLDHYAKKKILEAIRQ